MQGHFGPVISIIARFQSHTSSNPNHNILSCLPLMLEEENLQPQAPKVTGPPRLNKEPRFANCDGKSTQKIYKTTSYQAMCKGYMCDTFFVKRIQTFFSQLQIELALSYKRKITTSKQAHGNMTHFHDMNFRRFIYLLL